MHLAKLVTDAISHAYLFTAEQLIMFDEPVRLYG
jgi:hypothetical protein